MFKAIHDSVIVKVVYDNKNSSIIIPDNAMKFKRYDGSIRYIVESISEKSKFYNDLKIGDNIIIQRNEGKSLGKHDGNEYLCVSDKWIMGRY